MSRQLTPLGVFDYQRGLVTLAGAGASSGVTLVKIRNSIKSAKLRERNCVVVRRRGRLYVINKQQPRYKTRQG